MLRIVSILFLFIPGLALAGGNSNLLMKIGGNYRSYTDSENSGEFSGLKLQGMIGATFTKKHKLSVGWTVINWSTSVKVDDANAAEIGLMEMGPTFLWFFTEFQQAHLALTWLPYVKGTRTMSADSTEDEVTGSAIHASLTFMGRLGKTWRFGLSLNYHSTTLKKAVDDSDTESDISHKFTDIYPAIEIMALF